MTMSFYNPLPTSKLLKLFSQNDESDFLRSDYCDECGGSGYTWLIHENPMADNEKEQCPQCESIHNQEVRADRLHDEMKGN